MTNAHQLDNSNHLALTGKTLGKFFNYKIAFSNIIRILEKRFVHNSQPKRKK
jgi:hypothetical protein